MQRAMRAYVWTPAAAGATKVAITFSPDSNVRMRGFIFNRKRQLRLVPTMNHDPRGMKV